MILLKKFWWVALIIAGIVFFEWHGCKAGPDHSGDKISMDSVARVYTDFKKAALQRISVLQQDSARKDSVIDALEVEKINAERDLAQRGKAIDNTLASGDHFRIIHDTPAIVSNCDTLRKEVIEGKAAVIVYQGKTDSLIAAQAEAGRIKDSMAATWHNAFLHADTAVAYQQAKYNSVYADYVKVNRKLKFTNTIGKIGAGAIAVLATALLIKK